MDSRTISLADGRTLRAYDSQIQDAVLTIVWHHGSPQTGAILEPLLAAAADRGIRMLSFGRANYGGSSELRDRDVASVAADVAALADTFGVDRFAVSGASGGGPHALACAALLGERVTGVATFASLAPFGADIDWFGGMAADGQSLRAAVEGRTARERYEETAEFDPTSFNDLDYAALAESWADLGRDVGASEAWGTVGVIDDDLAFVKPWGFDVASIGCPALVAHGGDDSVVPVSHGEWLARAITDAELWLRPRAGHIAILDTVSVAMDWLLRNAR
ncbi:MAG TPA: alpha/beta hydrolase [Galbitalea sp.]|jgi:pimeloyl-ACP methyl ester carboxylesterase